MSETAATAASIWLLGMLPIAPGGMLVLLPWTPAAATAVADAFVVVAAGRTCPGMGIAWPGDVTFARFSVARAWPAEEEEEEEAAATLLVAAVAVAEGDGAVGEVVEAGPTAARRRLGTGLSLRVVLCLGCWLGGVGAALVLAPVLLHLSQVCYWHLRTDISKSTHLKSPKNIKKH